MKTRDKIFWLLWLAFVIALIWVCCHQAARAETRRIRVNRPGVYSPKGQEQIMPTTITLCQPALVPAFPKAIIIPPKPITNTVAWDYADLSTVTNFRLYRGSSPGIYTSTNLTGKVLSTTFVWTARTTNYAALTALGTNGLESLFSNEIRVPPIYTNLVVTVMSFNATNLQWATALGKPWTLYGGTNYTATNPAPRVWRGLGKSKTAPPILSIKATWQ